MAADFDRSVSRSKVFRRRGSHQFDPDQAIDADVVRVLARRGAMRTSTCCSYTFPVSIDPTMSAVTGRPLW